MEQHEQLPKTDNLLIGFNRYKFLKNLNKEDLTEEEKTAIENYESRNVVTQEQLEYKKKYIEKLTTPEVLTELVLSKKWVWENFLINFKLINGKEFIQSEESIENIKTIILYFLKNKEFFNCKNLQSTPIPDFDKGLLIVGNFGNGKTSSMMALEKTFKGIKNYNFKSYNANEVVKMFELITPDNFTIDLSRKDFDRKMTIGNIYFDDVKTERIASNYGKVNLFKEILEIRSSGKFKTFITCNFKEGYPDNIEMALDEFGEKYGDRVFDRIYEMFNVIEFKGKSFRK